MARHVGAEADELCRRYHRHEGVVGEGWPPTGSFSIFVGASGFLRARLHVRGRAEGAIELRLRRGERSIAVARGRTSLRLRAPVRRGTYRLVVTSSGGKPVRFKLAVAYPRAR